MIKVIWQEGCEKQRLLVDEKVFEGVLSADRVSVAFYSQQGCGHVQGLLGQVARASVIPDRPCR